MLAEFDFKRVFIAALAFSVFSIVWSMPGIFIPIANFLKLGSIFPLWSIWVLETALYIIVLYRITRWYFCSVSPNVRTGIMFGISLFVASTIIFWIYNMFTIAFFSISWSAGFWGNVFELILIMLVTVSVALISERKGI